MGWDRGWIAAACAACLLVALGCSGGSSAPPPSTAVPDRPTLEQALHALDCEPVGREPHLSEQDDFGIRCIMEDRWPTRVWAGLEDGRYGTKLRLLAERYVIDGTPDVSTCAGYAVDPVVVAGDGWIVLTSDIDGANHVRDVLGGRFQPGTNRGTPISFPALPCTGDPF